MHPSSYIGWPTSDIYSEYLGTCLSNEASDVPHCMRDELYKINNVSSLLTLGGRAPSISSRPKLTQDRSDASELTCPSINVPRRWNQKIKWCFSLKEKDMYHIERQASSLRTKVWIYRDKVIGRSN